MYYNLPTFYHKIMTSSECVNIVFIGFWDIVVSFCKKTSESLDQMAQSFLEESWLIMKLYMMTNIILKIISTGYERYYPLIEDNG